MSRFLTTPQETALKASHITATLLCEIYLDTETIYLCDDIDDVTATVNGASHTYVGANALFDTIEINASSGLAAEPVTIVLDGAKLQAAGLPSALSFFNSIMSAKFQQRRVNFFLYFRDSDSLAAITVWNLYAGKINTIRQVDEAVPFDAANPSKSVLEITLDSLAARYNRATRRLRTHEDQIELDPTDRFYAFVTSAVQEETSIYWGKAAPAGYVNPYQPSHAWSVYHASL